MTDHSVRPNRAASSPSSEARDLRALLAATVEALTLPYDVPDYDRRILDRAATTRVLTAAALSEDPADLAWNTDYLRAKLTAEQADAEARAAKRGAGR
ncbi:hypothetical protein [Streptomyces sp. NPDC001221]